MKVPDKVLVALDPGAAAAGVAVFEDGRLRHVDEFAGKDGWFARADQVVTFVEQCLSDHIHDDFLQAMVEVVIERPQVYAASRSRGDRNDLVDVSFMAGASVRGIARYSTYWCCNGFSVREYKPNQWKRSVPKPKKKGQPYVIEERVREKLAADEQPLIAGLGWDGIDAVGIGLVHLGRARPGVI